jgi:hypothetical protein
VIKSVFPGMAGLVCHLVGPAVQPEKKWQEHWETE